MDKQKKTPPREEKGASLEADAFLKEVEDNLEAWCEDATPALARLQSLSREGLERVFSSLVKNKAEEIYPFFQSILGREEKIDLPLADSLGRWNSPEAGILLQRLAEKSSSRAVLKNVRKSIFRLKSQGFKVDEIRDVSPAVFHPPQPVPAEGFLSALDGSGTRMVWLVRPQPPRGIAAFHALITDSQGIMDFQAFETSRKKFHEYVEEFRKQAPWEIVEADPEYCLGLMIEASDFHSKKGETPPGDFLKWKTVMGSPPAMPLRPLIHLHLREEEWKNRSDLLDRSGSLFESPSFHSWYLEEEEAGKYLTLLKEASESRLVLTPYQKEGRVMEIYRQAVEELFPRERRVLFRRRLEEMAYVFWKSGKESEAQMCFVAALGMESEGGILSIHPFLFEMVKRSLTVLLEEETKKQSKDGDLLIKP